MWTRVFETTANTESATECNLPGQPKPPPAPDKTPAPTPTSFGTTLPRETLDQIQPIPPQEVLVRVLNANGQSRQATLVSDELADYGFGSGGEPSNDPVYPHNDLKCHGQIRFGASGTGAARTLSLAIPCAQLVRDNRQDATVDLALGSEFDDIKMTTEAKQVLQQLNSWAAQHGQGAQGELAPPRIDSNLLTKARDVHC